MKKWKSILALALAIALCLTLLAACAKTPAAPSADENQTEQPADSADTPDTPDEPAAPDSDEHDEHDEITEIEVLLWHEGGITEEGGELVEAKLNEIAEKEIGVHANITYLSIGEYGTQVSMMIAGGEQLDLACTLPFGPGLFSAVTANGQAMAIEDLLNEYAPAIMAEAGEYLGAGTIKGHTYIIPTMRAKAMTSYFEYDKLYMQELGLEEQLLAVETWDDLDAVMAASVKAGDRYALGGKQWVESGGILTPDNKMFFGSYESLGDSYYGFAVDPDTMKIKRRTDFPLYEEKYQMLASWNEKGYIYPDTAVNTENIASMLCKQGLIWGWFVGSELGAEVTATAQAGTPVGVIPVSKGILNGNSFTNFATFVPVTSKEPEAAIKFMNLVFTDPEMENTLIYGVEGTHWVMGDDGMGHCPEGTDETTCGYHVGEFAYGNAYILVPWEGQGADFRDRQREDMRNSLVSPTLGFTPDTTEVSDYIAALASVCDQYFWSLSSGHYTPELYQDYINAQTAAGIDDYIANYQAQLDAWLAEQ